MLGFSGGGDPHLNVLSDERSRYLKAGYLGWGGGGEPMPECSKQKNVSIPECLYILTTKGYHI